VEAVVVLTMARALTGRMEVSVVAEAVLVINKTV
tara:strand:+ start:605 stop:706 length:102 start_codon:yes stop_codon:yes gene_type:complete